MLTFSEFGALLESQKDPLYVSVTPDSNTKATIKRIQHQYNIPNPLDTAKIHCTLIYSRTPCDKPIISADSTYNATFKSFDIFDTRDGKRCLVIKLTSRDLSARHKALMKEMGASYDFATYIPHITLSYDVGDYDWQQIKSSTIGNISFGHEKYSVLNEIWEKEN